MIGRIVALVATGLCLAAGGLWLEARPKMAESAVVMSTVSHDNGHAYLTLVPNAAAQQPSDSLAGSDVSKLQLLENDRPLGPAHSPHDDIRTLGQGRYSHWDNSIFFSSSDNSDPTMNGRTYSVRFDATAGPMRLLRHLMVVAGGGLVAVAMGWLLVGWALTKMAGRSTRGVAAAIALLAAIGICLAAGGRWLESVVERDIVPSAVSHESGNAYITVTPVTAAEQRSDSLTGSKVSKLQLLENGRPLGPRHSPHADIRQLGQGRYSHWDNSIYFSSSDNSDPTKNGRTYRVRFYRSGARPATATEHLMVVAGGGMAALAIGAFLAMVSKRRDAKRSEGEAGQGSAKTFGRLPKGVRRTVALLAVVGLCLAAGGGWLLSRPHAVDVAIAPSAVNHESGNAYVTVTPGAAAQQRSDSLAGSEVSTLQLLENGRPLGPPHSPHTDIRQFGQGRYSHWDNSIFFSTSDNSDPTKNGRTYLLRFDEPTAGLEKRAGQLMVLVGGALAAAAIVVLLVSRNSPPSNGPGAAIPKGETSPPGATVAGKPAKGINRAIALLAVAGLCLAAAGWQLQSKPRTVERDLSMATVSHEDGHAYFTAGPKGGVQLESDSMSASSISALQLLENGRLLGPPHASHNDVRQLGQGRYSHWDGAVFFSSSDNTDPTKNGRTYRFRYAGVVVGQARQTDQLIELSGIGLTCASIIALLILRAGASSASETDFAWANALQTFSIVARGLATPRSLLSVLTLTGVYAAVILLIYATVVAQQSTTGKFKINFEYRMF